MNKLMPEIPTEEMMQAAIDQVGAVISDAGDVGCTGNRDLTEEFLREAYEAMRGAAPSDNET